MTITDDWIVKPHTNEQTGSSASAYRILCDLKLGNTAIPLPHKDYTVAWKFRKPSFYGMVACFGGKMDEKHCYKIVLFRKSSILLKLHIRRSRGLLT